MNPPALSLRPAGRTLDYVETLLEREGLPTGDVRAKPECFFVAEADGQRVGIGGIERHGAEGLLRSVVVDPARRGEGLGGELCAALEKRAQAGDVEALYLLTTTAADFFAGRGYEAIDRTDAPAAIRETAEFEDLCPDSATPMKKTL